jgi:alpha-tubulin suppressor-like RCC1 family protein
MNVFPFLIRTLFLCLLLFLAIGSQAQPVTAIAAGYDHTLFVRSDGSLWATGINVYGELGDGTSEDTNLPEMIVSSNVTAVAAGYNYSLFLKNDGSLWGMGYNFDGELGDGSNNSTNVPEMIVASNVVAIAARYEHTLFIKSDGSLWGMGRNTESQLGNGTVNFTNRPEMIVSSNVTAIAAGAAHSLFLMTNGSVWGMGLGDDGQLCDGSYFPYSSPIYITNGVKAIAAGYYHSLLLMTNGSLWVAGNDDYGQLGNGQFSFPSISTPLEMATNNVTAVAAGNFNSFFMKNDGSLWAAGENGIGQLGDGQMNFNYPQAGTNQLEKILNSGVVAISAGDEHSILIKNDGSLWGMGTDYGIQPADGGFYDYSGVPVPIVKVPQPYNQILPHLLDSGKIVLTYDGNATKRYAFDRCSSLVSPAWIPQTTNITDLSGLLVFTNSFAPNSYNFWRARSVP